jgi:hypothetical protein
MFPLAVLLLLGCGEQPFRTAAGENVTFTPMGTSGYTMLMPGSITPEEMTRAAKARCAGKAFCAVQGWIDPDRGGGGAGAEDLAFSYILNQRTGFGEESLWDCRRWPKPRAQCLG